MEAAVDQAAFELNRYGLLTLFLHHYIPLALLGDNIYDEATLRFADDGSRCPPVETHHDFEHVVSILQRFASNICMPEARTGIYLSNDVTASLADFTQAHPQAIYQSARYLPRPTSR